MRIAAITLLGLFCTLNVGCVGTRHTKFDESQAKYALDPGTAKVTGQAFLKTRGGDVKYGAGNTVMLIPACDYFTEDYERAVVNGENLEKPMPDLVGRFMPYVKKTVADGSGNFEFGNLAAGTYYVECPITWEVGAGLYATTTGGMAHARAVVKDGETIRVVATRQ